jgi:hypothetical protein
VDRKPAAQVLPGGRTSPRAAGTVSLLSGSVRGGRPSPQSYGSVSRAPCVPVNAIVRRLEALSPGDRHAQEAARTRRRGAGSWECDSGRRPTADRPCPAKEPRPAPPYDFGPVLPANHDAPIVIASDGPSLSTYPLRNIPHPQDDDAVLGRGAEFDQAAGPRLLWTFTSFLVMPPAPVRLKTLPSRRYGVSEKSIRCDLRDTR